MNLICYRNEHIMYMFKGLRTLGSWVRYTRGIDPFQEGKMSRVTGYSSGEIATN
jgi:hypothetical protein